MKFLDVIIEKTTVENSESVELNEGIIPITPFLAFLTLKRRAFNAVKNNVFVTTGKLVKKGASEKVRGAESKVLSATEKVKASLETDTGSKDPDNTVYKFTPEQVRVMEKIYDKYGKALVKRIKKFRVNILSQYQIIKKYTKKNSRLTSKETFGMNRDEYRRAVETGKRKISLRGDAYWSEYQDIKDHIKKLGFHIQDLETAKQQVMSGQGISPNVAEKVYKVYGVSEANFKYHLEDLQKTCSAIEKNLDAANNSSMPIEARVDAVINNIDNWEKGKEIHQKETSEKDRFIKNLKIIIEKGQKGGLSSDTLTFDKKEGDDEEINTSYADKDPQYKKVRGNFNYELGLYMFRTKILNRLRDNRGDNEYKILYRKMIDRMIEHDRKLMQDDYRSIADMQKILRFTPIEDKVWGRVPGSKEFSSNINDYYLKAKEDDLFDPIYIKKNPSVVEAEKRIDAEIKSFERYLQKVMAEEDFKLLKKYRLINNLITFRELKDPINLFKADGDYDNEVKNQTGSEMEEIPDDTENEVNPTQEEKEVGRVTSMEVIKDLEDLLTIEFDNDEDKRTELEKVKVKVDQLKSQYDKDVFEQKMRTILNKVNEKFKTNIG